MSDTMWTTIGQAVTDLRKQIQTEMVSVKKLYQEFNKPKFTKYELQEWTQAVDNAHTSYTNDTQNSNQYVEALENRKNSLPTNPTLDDYENLATLALDCAWFAIYAAQSRIGFMETYDRAYEAESIREHIDYVVGFLQTASRSTNHAQDAFRVYLSKTPNRPRPHVPSGSAS